MPFAKAVQAFRRQDWTTAKSEIDKLLVATPKADRKKKHGHNKHSAHHGKENISTYEYNLGGNGKSQILGTAGFIKLVRKNNGPVIGVHMIGSRVGEQIGEGQLIVNWEAYPEDVAALIHAHPTMNEAIGEAHLALAGKPLHAHA